jgi:hypothetical protein
VDGSLALAGEGGERVAASAGLRSFRYDPDAAYDWDGAALGVRYERAAWEAAVEAAGGEGASSLALALGYRLEARSYRGPALRNGCAPDAPVTPACFVATGAARGDLHHVLDLEATYTGDVVVTAAYALTVDDSSSFGQSLVRHRGAVAATVPLPAALYLTGSVALLFDQYLDPVLLARDVASQGFTSIDDDNRSAAALRLSRVLGAGVTAELRWAFHADSLSSDDLPFRRHVAYAGLVWDSGSGTW